MRLPDHVRAWVFAAEGGLSKDADDRGGETKFGISKRQYPELNIAALTAADAEKLYHRDYWTPIHGDELPASIALAMFDAAVLQGPVTATHMLQLALGKLGYSEVRADGIMGPVTLASAKAAELENRKELLATLLSFRGLRMFHDAEQNVKQRKFVRGWLARLFRLEAAALALGLVLLLIGCNGLPPIHVCPDGSVTTGPCPSPTPCATPPPQDSGCTSPDGCHWICPTPRPSPLPSPTPRPEPSPTPSPTPVPSPLPTPSPSPSPCEPRMETVPFECPAGTVNQCWQCADRIAWDIERGNWAPLPGSTLLVNFIGGDPKRPEYLDRNCNYVRRDGSIIRTAEQQYGMACVDGNAICPPSRTILHPCPSPLPPPSPGPTPSPTLPPTGPCPAIAGLGGQVAQFQFQHQTVTYHREGEGGQLYVANGPADKVNFDTTVYFGCAAPRCDSEHDPSLARCEDLKGQRWRVLSGNVRNCEPTNPGDDGRGFGFACDAGPGDGSVEACTVQPFISTETGEHVPGSACRVIHWRIP